MPTHLEEYLSYYKKQKNPGFALLVTGEWGTGKTHQVLKALKEEERWYLSLFGLQTTAELNTAILAAIDPSFSQAKKFFDGIGNTSKSAGGIYALGGLIPGVFNVVFRKKLNPCRTLIFDDLERSSIPINDIFGIINLYVEQFKFRVVIISHDKKIIKKLLKVKEKIIGQTIRVTPEIDESFDYFCSSIQSEKKKNFLINHKKIITNIFIESNVKSLRTLRHLIDDIGRLYESLTDNYLENDIAMSELVSLFSAFNIEIRSGNLLEADLQNRFHVNSNYEINRYVFKDQQRKGEIDAPPLVISNAKYSTVDLESNILQDNALVEMLIKGRYDSNSIQYSLDNSHHFIQALDQEKEDMPWKIVINFMELDDKIVTTAFEVMKRQFFNRESSNSGEMLHIFALMLLMSEKGVISESVEDIEKLCLSYIDDLLKSGNLEPRGTGRSWKDVINNGYSGYGYWTTDVTRPKFSIIYNHLIESREKAFDIKLPILAEDILNLVRTDGSEFYEKVCFTNNGDNPYAQIPILLHISPENFVEAWLSSPHKNWEWITNSIKDRYESSNLSTHLSSEKKWAKEVFHILEKKICEAHGFQKLRIERTIPRVLRFLAADEHSDG